MATAPPSQHLHDVTLQPPATKPIQKHHLFSSVWPHQCSHAISIWTAAAGLWLYAAPILDCETGFYQLIRWYMTPQFDQTVHRVLLHPLSNQQLLDVSLCFILFPLPHSRFHSNKHTRAEYSMFLNTHKHCVIIAKTALLTSLNSSIQKVYHLSFKPFLVVFPFHK